MNKDIETIESPKAAVSEQKKLQPKWKNEPSFEDLQKDLTATNAAHAMYREQLSLRQENFAGGKPIVTAIKGKSTTRPKLIRKQAEWKYASLEEPFLSTRDMFKIDPRTAEDADAAYQNQVLINYQWATKVNKVELIGSIVRNLVDEGTVIVKTGWKAKEGTRVVEKEVPVYASPEESVVLLKQKIENGEISYEEAQSIMASGQPMQRGTKMVYEEETVLLENRPTYEVCNSANVRIDPSCEGVMEDAKFVIHEYDTSFAELKENEHTVRFEEEEYFDEKSGTVKTKKVKYESGFYKNLDVLRELDIQATADPYASVSGQTFKFSDRPRKKIRAFEYWGFWDINGDENLVPIVATWVNGVLIRLEENPFPHKSLPFSKAVYMPVKREVHGESDGDLLVDNQNTIGRMIRASEDITITQAVGQTLIDEQFLPSPIQKSNLEKGNTVYFRHGMNPKEAIYKQTVSPVPESVFQIINMQHAEAESLSGTKAFSQGISGSAFGSVAQNTRSALDATSKRELSILRRLSEMFKDLARKTVAMNQAFLEEEEVVRITSGFIPVRRDDLAGEFDFDMDISTAEKDNETAQKLTMLLQTNAANMNPEIMHKMYKKIALLWKMPDLAEDLGEFVPPAPQPFQIELQKMQLENARLENIRLMKEIEELDSRISERVSRSIENESDIRTKDSQSELRAAQARKLNAEADLKDQQFVKDGDGSSFAEKAELNRLQNEANLESQMRAAEHRRLTDLDKIALQHEAAKRSEGLSHDRAKDFENHKSGLAPKPEQKPAYEQPVFSAQTQNTEKGE